MNEDLERMILTGYANGDLHRAPLQMRQTHTDAAALEGSGVGALSNAGFRVLVASVWMNVEKKTASVDFVIVWEGNEPVVIVKSGDRIATSHELYAKLKGPAEDFGPAELLEICHRLQMS